MPDIFGSGGPKSVSRSGRRYRDRKASVSAIQRCHIGSLAAYARFLHAAEGSRFGRYRAGVLADRAKFGPAKLPWVRRYRPRLSGTSRVIAASQTPIPVLQRSVARSNK